MPEFVRDWAAHLVTSGLVLLVGVLLKRAVTHVDRTLDKLAARLESALEKVAQHDTRHAVTESRLSQQDARLAKVEGDVGMLHSRLSRLITDKLFSEEK